MKSNKKVYIVHTGIYIPGEGDSSNWSSYKTIATSAEDAIKNVKSKFQENEYAESVELVLVLDR